MKTHLEDELRRRHPEYDGIKTYKIPAADALEIFAERHPDLTRDQALQQGGAQEPHPLLDDRAGRVRADAVGQGQADVVLLLPRRRRALHLDADADLAGRSSCSPAALGLLAGLIRRRDPLLGAVLITIALSAPLIHTIVVSQARYNVPLMPSLIAAGVAGWFLALRSAARRPRPRLPRCRHGTRKIGIWRSKRHGAGGLAEIEALGYGALGSAAARASTQARPYLEAASTLPVATGILNVWQHDPADVAAAHARAHRATSRTASCSASASATRRRPATTRAR